MFQTEGPRKPHCRECRQNNKDIKTRDGDISSSWSSPANSYGCQESASKLKTELRFADCDSCVGRGFVVSSGHCWSRSCVHRTCVVTGGNFGLEHSQLTSPGISYQHWCSICSTSSNLDSNSRQGKKRLRN